MELCSCVAVISATLLYLTVCDCEENAEFSSSEMYERLVECSDGDLSVRLFCGCTTSSSTITMLLCHVSY